MNACELDKLRGIIHYHSLDCDRRVLPLINALRELYVEAYAETYGEKPKVPWMHLDAGGGS